MLGELKLIIDHLPIEITRENEEQIRIRLNRLDWPIQAKADLLGNQWMLIHIGLYNNYNPKYFYGKRQFREIKEYIKHHLKNDVMFVEQKIILNKKTKYQLSFFINF